MKISLKRLLIFIITTILLFANSPVLTARYEINDGDIGITPETEQGLLNPNYYKPYTTSDSDSILKEKVGPILGIINAVGVVCSVIMIIVIGLKYMLGSVEQKAEYKKTMLAYLIGAFLLFSSTTIPNIIYTWINGGSTGSGGSTVTEVVDPRNPNTYIEIK